MTVLPEVEAEIRRLVLRDGWKIETAARRFGVHHTVVRRVIKSVEATAGPKPATKSILEPFKPYVVERLAELPELTATRLLFELKDRGYEGGAAVLRRLVRKIRVARSRKAYLRIETEPGEQAQVDWGSFGHMRIGSSSRPLSCFAMVLSWSRALFVDFSLDQRLDTFMRMHERAFEFFGGIPRKVLYDNLKSVVLHHVGSVVQFNPNFLVFAGHHLFETVAAPVRYPQAKGRVESAIKYVRHAFFYGRTYKDLADLREQARLWCLETANQRIHATTRERPCERLLIERPRLHALPEHRFDSDLVVPAVVGKEARVILDTNAYSVPPDLVGKSVLVRADDTAVRVVDGTDVVAEHPRSWDRRRAFEKPEHIQDILDRRPGAKGPKRRDRIAALSETSRIYLQEVSRRRIDLRSEVDKLARLIARYGEADVVMGIGAALGARTFGAGYVRAHIDQKRFAEGLGEPPEPVVTGRKDADEMSVEPHDLGGYDDLF
jgi:transposase